MCGKIIWDRIRNYDIRERERVEVSPIIEKMVETRRMWFGHIERRHVDYVVSRIDHMVGSQITRGRARSRKL